MPDHMTKTLLKPDTSGCKPFELSAFFPYRIRVFYTLVSSAVAGIYQQDHDTQIYNAQRWGVDLDQFPKISTIKASLDTTPAFIAAYPKNHAA